MFTHDLTIALRRIIGQCFQTCVGIAVLTLGLVCFIAANLFVSYLRNYDRHWTWLLACLAVGGCAWRAARLHPAAALRD